MPLDQLSLPHIEELRHTMRHRERRLSEKTIRNVIDGSFRAMVRDAMDFYDLFRDAQTALEISPLRDLYSAKDTYISHALTNGAGLPWLSEQTGVALSTLLKHYGRFVHSSEVDDLELAKIDGNGRRAGAPRGEESPRGIAEYPEAAFSLHAFGSVSRRAFRRCDGRRRTVKRTISGRFRCSLATGLAILPLDLGKPL